MLLLLFCFLLSVFLFHPTVCAAGRTSSVCTISERVVILLCTLDKSLLNFCTHFTTFHNQTTPKGVVTFRNVMAELHDDLKCGICLELFQDPRSLPCLHTFCRECIQRSLNEENHSLKCPVCRAEHELSDGRGSYL